MTDYAEQILEKQRARTQGVQEREICEAVRDAISVLKLEIEMMSLVKKQDYDGGANIKRQIKTILSKNNIEPNN